MSDLREQLQAAFEGHAADMGAEPVIAPPVVEVEMTPVATEAAEQPAKAAAPDAGPRRDETGKFAPKETPEAASETAAAPIPSTEPTPPPETEPQTEATRVPAFLPAALKAEWKDLPPQWQTAIAKQEESVQVAKAEWSKKGERLNRFEEIIAPRREKLILNGIDDATWFQRLAAAEDVLERNPVEGFHYLARLYNVDLRALAGQASGPGVMQQPFAPHGQTAPAGLDPNLDPIRQEIQALKATIEGQAKSTQAAALASAEAEIAMFSSNPENMYFENVKDDVADLLERGRAKTLSEAYEMAIWASPEIRPLLQKAAAPTSGADPQAAAKKAAEDAQRKKAADAQRSSGSVTGAPTPGAGPAQAAPKASIREQLLASVDELGARL